MTSDVESLMYTAAVCHRQGGKLLIFFNKQSHCIFESAGRTFCAAQLCMRTLTPAGSFFVPAVRGWGKSHNIKPLSQEVCMAIIHIEYPVDCQSVSTDIRQSMRAAHIKALRSTRNNPNRNINQPSVELAALTEHLERIIILLEGNCYERH